MNLLRGIYRSILGIGDLHAPYQHIDAFDFLYEIKKKYKPDLVIDGGDETDQHAWSFHEHNPMLPNPEEELSLAKREIKILEEIFPEMHLLESNHGSLVYRQQVAKGLPRGVFKTYNEIYGVSKKWQWHKDIVTRMSNKMLCYWCHGKSSDVLKTSQSMGMSVVQFHYHEKMGVQYWGNPLGLYFAAQAGCLVDDNSLAMEYNKLNLKRPLIGSIIIVNGHPKPLPMVLNRRGRWIGKLV